MAQDHPPEDDKPLNLVNKHFSEADSHHQIFRDTVEESYKAWRAVLEKKSTAAQWESKMAPPYIQHIVETSLASMMDEDLKFKIEPLPTLNAEPDELEFAEQGAEALEILLRQQLQKDRINEKMRPALLQDAIAGFTPFKVFWKTETRERTRRVADNPDQFTGELQLKTETKTEKVFDQPTLEVRDVRDFMWPEAATSLDTAEWVIDRFWLTIDDLRLLEKEGVINNVSKVNESQDFSGEGSVRENLLFSADRTRDRIEVLEHWTNDRVITIANRKVVLRDQKNPFWHGRKPFVTLATQSDLFRLPGISQVDKIKDIQLTLWSLQNQRLDNLTMIANAIAVIRSDVEDPDEFQWRPRARWFVEDPSQVSMLDVNPIPAQVSVPAEALAKGDMQNLGGGFPFSSSTEAQTVDQKTATGAAIISNIAQKSLGQRKTMVNNALMRIGQMWIELNQQFIEEDVLVRDVGIDNATEIIEIAPLVIQGDFAFRIKPTDESLMRAERRAEATSNLQMALQTAPVAAQFAQMGVGRMINLDKFIEDYLEHFGITNTDQYFVSQTPQAPQGQPPAGQPGQGPLQPEQSTNGVTAPQSIDPAVSPSNQTSLSPAQFVARAKAQSGGLQQ